MSAVIVAEADEPEEEIEFPVTAEFEEVEKRLNISQYLEVEQNTELKALLAEFGDVFSNAPGRTDLVACKQQVRDEVPCTQASYKPPDSLKAPVEEKLLHSLADVFLVRTRQGGLI